MEYSEAVNELKRLSDDRIRRYEMAQKKSKPEDVPQQEELPQPQEDKKSDCTYTKHYCQYGK